MHQTFDILDYVDYGEKSDKTPKNEQKVSHGLGNHCIIQTRALDRATAVSEQDAFSELCKLLAEVLQLIFSKVNLDRDVIDEVVHILVKV